MTLAELKRRLTLGTQVLLVGASWLAEGETLLRTVTTVQGNAIAMTPGNNRPDKANVQSWLYWKGVKVTETLWAHADGSAPDRGFKVVIADGPDDPYAVTMVYQWV